MSDFEIQKNSYLKIKGVKCFFCPSTDIEGGSVDIGAGEAMQEVKCNECSGHWTDIYTLTDVMDIEEGKEVKK